MPTITKHSKIVIGVAVVISAAIVIFGLTRKSSSASPKFSYDIFNSRIGWGYEILENDKPIIHQDFVPALPVQKGFSKKEYAEKAAQLVMQKIHGQSDFPSLSEKDLLQICPLDKIVYDSLQNQ